MNSKLFSRFDPGAENNKQFLQDLNVLSGLALDQIDQLLTALETFSRAETPEELRQVYEEAEKATGLPRFLLNQLAALADFFVGNMLDDNIGQDDCPNWISDLQEAGLVDDKNRAQLSAFLDGLSERADQLSKTALERAAESGVLPTLRSFGTTVELRAIQKSRYRIGTNVENYQPKLTGVVPIVSVFVRLDSGTPSSFVFQAPADDLTYFIDVLRAAQKDASALLKQIEFAPTEPEEVL